MARHGIARNRRTSWRTTHESTRARCGHAGLRRSWRTMALAGALLLRCGLATRHASAAHTAPVGPEVSRPHAPRLAIARLQYEGGGDWYANPSSLPNLLAAIASAPHCPSSAPRGACADRRGAVSYPFLHATGHGEMRLSDAEVVACASISRAAAFCMSTTTTDSTRASGARSRGSFPIARWSKCRPRTRSTMWCTTCLDGLPKIHEHDGKPAKGSASFSAIGWPCTTAIRAISATAGKTSARTLAIRRSCTSGRCAWA
jgi:hypothetical protein